MLQTVVSVDPLTESNCYILVENDRCLVIDPGEHERLLSILKDFGWEPELILLTHEHCDHMAGLDALRDQYPQACFAATAVCNAGIQSLRLNLSRIMEVYMYFRENPGIHYEPFVCRPADEIVAGDAQLEWRGHLLRLVPLPGHTPGSGGIFLDEEVFFSGDYLIQNEEPLLRFPGGDAESYEKITKPFLRSLPAGIRICPGHGEPYNNY